MKKLLLATALLCSSAAANANWYVTASVGISDYDAPTAYLEDGDQLSDWAVSVGGGYSFNDTFSVEAEYANLGTYTVSRTLESYYGDSTTTIEGGYDYISTGIVLSAGSMYLKAGLALVDGDISIESTSDKESIYGLSGSESVTTTYTGVGVSWGVFNAEIISLDGALVSRIGLKINLN